MPQINPINWLILFLYFSRLFIGCIVKLHYINLKGAPQEQRDGGIVRGNKFFVEV